MHENTIVVVGPGLHTLLLVAMDKTFTHRKVILKAGRHPAFSACLYTIHWLEVSGQSMGPKLRLFLIHLFTKSNGYLQLKDSTDPLKPLLILIMTKISITA